jgi:hypothetical protein
MLSDDDGLRAFSFGPQAATVLDEVSNVDHIDCSSSIVFARRWRVGIFSLAQITPAPVHQDPKRSGSTFVSQYLIRGLRS